MNSISDEYYKITTLESFFLGILLRRRCFPRVGGRYLTRILDSTSRSTSTERPWCTMGAPSERESPRSGKIYCYDTQEKNMLCAKKGLCDVGRRSDNESAESNSEAEKVFSADMKKGGWSLVILRPTCCADALDTFVLLTLDLPLIQAWIIESICRSLLLILLNIPCRNNFTSKKPRD